MYMNQGSRRAWSYSLKRLRLHFPGARIVRDRFEGLLPGARRRRDAMLRFFGQFVKPGDLCFDVGANCGSRTDILLELGASVVVVEPQDSCLQVLRRKLGSNRRVQIVAKGVGHAEGNAQLWTCEEGSVLATVSDRWRNQSRFAGR